MVEFLIDNNGGRIVAPLGHTAYLCERFGDSRSDFRHFALVGLGWILGWETDGEVTEIWVSPNRLSDLAWRHLRMSLALQPGPITLRAYVGAYYVQQCWDGTDALALLYDIAEAARVQEEFPIAND